MRSFKQVDVFTDVPYRGNPVAVVIDADGIDDEEMARFASWANLSETTFLLPPSEPSADYRVRIFTPSMELPFAGHPTIGTCHAWIEAGGVPKAPGTIVQECGIGSIALRHADGRLAFAAPPLIRSGPVDESDIARACRVLGIDRSDVVDAQWVDNGPGWIAVMLESAQAVLDLTPDFSVEGTSDIGIVGAHPLGVVGPTGIDDPAIEVRAWFPNAGAAVEDPVTGSLNAALAQWLLADGHVVAPYVASQGTALGRSGRVYIDETDGEIWVGGHAVTCIEGKVDL